MDIESVGQGAIPVQAPAGLRSSSLYESEA